VDLSLLAAAVRNRDGFRAGTNDHRGSARSPDQPAGLVYARRLSQTNVVLVSKTVLDAVQTPFNELRDRRLVTFAPALVDRIEVLADEKFGWPGRRMAPG
jgi:hypothetical protein